MPVFPIILKVIFMIYKNSRTGEIINVKSIIHGGYWQAVEPAATADTGENEGGESKKPTRAKKCGKE